MEFIEFWRSHASELGGMVARHVLLVVVATLTALAIGLPLGIVAATRPRAGRPLVLLTNIVQTIPSLALFGFLLPLPFIGGVGARTALVALVLYGILPILQTTAAGLAGIDRTVRQAAVAMGLTEWQRLTRIELPLAVPSILAGVRVSAVTGVGTATIAAAIGAGGLGEYIFRGLAMVDASVILAGAIPAAALAILADALLAAAGRAATDRRRRHRSDARATTRGRSASAAFAGSSLERDNSRSGRSSAIRDASDSANGSASGSATDSRSAGERLNDASTPDRDAPMAHHRSRLALWLGAIALVLLAAAALAIATRPPTATITVGSKNFTEQIVLGELLSQTIERRTDLHVTRKLNLGGTLICERALASGDIDLYAEYTGTALTAIFKQPVVHDRQRALDIVRERYAATGRTQLDALGFNNTFAILVRGADARRLGLRTISDAVAPARSWRAAFGYEFLEREDGYTGLQRTYGLTFSEPPRVMDLNLSYRALAARQVDMIAGDATAGAIASLDLFMLADDRQYFPPYDAVPVVRSATLLAHPELRDALRLLAGVIDEAAMRRMNEAVDIAHRDAAQVAREFLDARGITALTP